MKIKLDENVGNIGSKTEDRDDERILIFEDIASSERKASSKIMKKKERAKGKAKKKKRRKAKENNLTSARLSTAHALRCAHAFAALSTRLCLMFLALRACVAGNAFSMDVAGRERDGRRASK